MLSDDEREHIHGTLGDWQVPGCAIALVQWSEGKWESHVEGFGLKNETDPVDDQTLFCIASNTKLFTVLSLHILLEKSKEKLSWSSLVQDVIPDFDLVDKIAAAECTLEDLACHRTGVGNYSHSYTPFESLDRILDHLKVFKPARNFRDSYLYCNWTYDFLALIVQRLSGVPFETFVKQTILDPLSMEDTTFNAVEGKASGKLAAGYNLRERVWDDSQDIVTLSNGTNEVVESGMIGHVALRGAGGMMSSGRDMVRWLQFLLSENSEDNPIPESANFFALSRKGRTIVDPVAEFPDLSPRLYGLARRIGSYQGIQFIEHGGNVPGYMSQVCIVPNEKFGVAILTNSSPWGDLAYNIIKWRLFENRFGLKHIDWHQRYTAQRQKQWREDCKALEVTVPDSQTDADSSTIQELIGTYKCGPMELSIAPDTIVPRKSFPKLEPIPPFPFLWGKASLVISARENNVFDGCLKYMPLGPKGKNEAVRYGIKLYIEVASKNGATIGIGVKGLMGRERTVSRLTLNSIEDRADLYFEKVS